MLRILHFADAHIDMASHGRHDPSSGLPLRVLDFLKALDTIVDTALNEKVDLVLFAGDAYKDRSPAPTFQREWGKRMMRLSQGGVPVLLLVGNHDLSPAAGRAHALQEYETLAVPGVRVAGKPALLGPADLFGLPLQVIALPWVARSGMVAALGLDPADAGKVFETLESKLSELAQSMLQRADSSLPIILAAHASVQGAMYGAERSVMLGSDLVLSGSLVRDPRLDYVALGHIHKAQDLNKDSQPPVVYPGSIERVDWGEAPDDKYFVIARLEKGSRTQVEWRRLEGRRFIDRVVRLTKPEDFSTLDEELAWDDLEDAIVRLTVIYPRRWDNLLDEAALRSRAEKAFEFHLLRKPQMESRLRLPGDRAISSLTPADLLGLYWESLKAGAKEAEAKKEETEALQKLAGEIFAGDSPPGASSET